MRPADGPPRFERRPQERPGELLAAALQTFAERGYRATRLDEVAARAGVSKGTIYLYFQNKEDLLLSSLAHHLELLYEESLAHLEDQPGPSADRLRHALRRLWSAAQHPDWGRVYGLIIGEIATEHPAVFRQWTEQGAIRVWATLAAIIRQGQRSGELRADVGADEAARLLATGLLHQVYLQAHTAVGEIAPVTLDALAEAAVRVFVDGLLPARTAPA